MKRKRGDTGKTHVAEVETASTNQRSSAAIEHSPPRKCTKRESALTITKPDLLQTLPRELRDIIYDYAFRQRVVLEQHPQTAGARGAGLLCASRQTYQEGRQYYYQNATFVCRDRPPILTWLGVLDGPTRKLITDIQYECKFFVPTFLGYLPKILLRDIRNSAATDLAAGVLKVLFIRLGSEKLWFSIDMTSNKSEEDDLRAFEDFQNPHNAS